jgi:hypothetical protein
MESIIMGIAGVPLVAVMTTRIRQSMRSKRATDYQVEWRLDDPNSTMSVTREVLAEKLGPTRADMLISRPYAQNSSNA